jgi:hypothetical protein
MKVFGDSLLATRSFSKRNLIHAGTITVEFLDNNEDGAPDDLTTNTSLSNRYGTMFLAGMKADEEFVRQSAGGIEERNGPLSHVQNMARQYEFETNPSGTLCGSATSYPAYQLGPIMCVRSVPITTMTLSISIGGSRHFSELKVIHILPVAILAYDVA